MRIKKFFAALTGCILLLSCSAMTAFAEVALPDGAVKGLPQKLTAMDNEGNVVSSETGEYFFRVENMSYGETYTKDVQLMNLRDDHAYHIYFYVEPLWKNGEIDLEKGCNCKFFLDGEQFYNGSVTGNGNFDLTKEIKDLGYYEPGDSHTLSCSVIWNNLDVMQSVDNGNRLVDKDGEHILVGPDDEGHAEGQIEFKWIFYAAVDENYKPPDTGLLNVNNSFWLICCAIMLLLIIIMLILTSKKRQKKAAQN